MLCIWAAEKALALNADAEKALALNAEAEN
jgi:hypothetical protein